MVKKKSVKRVKKAVKAKKGKKIVKAKGVKKIRKIKKAVASTLPKKPTEKVLGMIDHYFGKIGVAAIKMKAPVKVGDVIHIKGHTTDFVQRVDSIQIEDRKSVV